MAAIELTPARRAAFDDTARDFQRIFGDRFVAFVVYAHDASVAFTQTLTAADLEACAALNDTWHRHGVATPLVMTADEFLRSLDCFPLEYQAILDAHVVIAGTPPFANVAISTDELRRACEIQVQGHLLHVRQAWLQSGGHGKALAARVAASAPQLRALLMSVARLATGSPATDDLANFAATTAGMPRDLVAAILRLEADPSGAPAAARRMPEYIAAVERLWSFVDTWHA